MGLGFFPNNRLSWPKATSVKHCLEDGLFQSKGAGFGRGHTSAQAELVRAEPLERDLIHFGLAIPKTYMDLVSET